MKLFILMLAIVSCLSAQDQNSSKTNIAILNLDAIEISAQEAQILTKKLSSELVKQGMYTVLDRGEMEAILQEQGFQQTGCTSSECAVEVGQLLGVQKMIAGSVGKLGTIYYVEVRMIDVTSSKIDKTVDHNQEGTIEKVLTVSMPYIAATLSNKQVVEPAKAKEDSTLFVETQSQKVVVDTVVPVAIEKPKELTLFSHHNRGTIIMDGKVLGKDKIVITADNTDVILQEKKWFYTSKPDTVNLAKKKGNTAGVGGNAKEAILSAGYFSARNGESILPAVRLSAGVIRQSANSHELALIFGGLDGIGMFTDTPSATYDEKTGIVVVGGFYEWCYDIELGQVLKIGAGVGTGYMLVREQTLRTIAMPITLPHVTQTVEVPVLNDITYVSFGGPKVRTAIGYKKIFLESMVTFNMGIQNISSQRANLVASEWINLDKNPLENYGNGVSFKVMPMLSLNLLLTL